MDWSTVGLMVGLGVVLSASTGLRAFVAPFILACAGGLGWVQLSDQLSWLATPLAIGALAIAIILEILADKVPLVDHAMDTAHLLVKPAAGALASAALVDGNSPMMGWAAALVGGGAVAGMTHVAKAGLRVGSTSTTFGAGNPVISVVEDLIAVALGGGVVLGIHLMG